MTPAILANFINVLVNSKPDHPNPQPGKTPRQFFWWPNSPPPGKKGVQYPHTKAYKNELKPHPLGYFLIIHHKNMKKWDRNHEKLQDFIIFRWLKGKSSLQLSPVYIMGW